MSRCADDDVVGEQSHGFAEVIAFPGLRGFQRSQEIAGFRIEIHDSGFRVRAPSSQGTNHQQLRVARQCPAKIFICLRIRRNQGTLQPSTFPIEKKHLSMVNRVRAAERSAHRQNGTQERHRMSEPGRLAVVRFRRNKRPEDFTRGRISQMDFPDLKVRHGTRSGVADGDQQILRGHGMSKRRCRLIGTDDHLPRFSRVAVEYRNRSHGPA